jgi:hypothetical protein
MKLTSRRRIDESKYCDKFHHLEIKVYKCYHMLLNDILLTAAAILRRIIQKSHQVWRKSKRFRGGSLDLFENSLFLFTWRGYEKMEI